MKMTKLLPLNMYPFTFRKEFAPMGANSFLSEMSSSLMKMTYMCAGSDSMTGGINTLLNNFSSHECNRVKLAIF